MKGLVICLFVLSACGAEKEFECEYAAAGMCVNTNGYDVSIDMIEYVVERVGDYYNELYEEDIVLEYMLEDNNVTLEFVDYIDPADADLGDEVLVGGDYSPDTKHIRVVYSERERLQCQLDYFVLAHELLHFIAHVYMDMPDSFQRNHSVKYFWGKDSIESFIWDELGYVCE
jgi:hypothetical protein